MHMCWENDEFRDLALSKKKGPDSRHSGDPIHSINQDGEEGKEAEEEKSFWCILNKHADEGDRERKKEKSFLSRLPSSCKAWDFFLAVCLSWLDFSFSHIFMQTFREKLFSLGFLPLWRFFQCIFIFIPLCQFPPLGRVSPLSGQRDAVSNFLAVTQDRDGVVNVEHSCLCHEATHDTLVKGKASCCHNLGFSQSLRDEASHHVSLHMWGKWETSSLLHVGIHIARDTWTRLWRRNGLEQAKERGKPSAWQLDVLVSCSQLNFFQLNCLQ